MGVGARVAGTITARADGMRSNSDKTASSHSMSRNQHSSVTRDKVQAAISMALSEDTKAQADNYRSLITGEEESGHEGVDVACAALAFELCSAYPEHDCSRQLS